MRGQVREMKLEKSNEKESRRFISVFSPMVNQDILAEDSSPCTPEY